MHTPRQNELMHIGPKLLLPKRFPLGSAKKKPLTPFVAKPPKPWRRIEPIHDKAIVIPWLSTAAVWDELKYSLRSIDRHFADKECPIYVIGNAAPSWLKQGQRVRFLEIEQYRESNDAGLWEAWQIGAQIAKEVMWTNDDIYFLRDTGWDDLRTALSCGLIDDAAPELRSSMNTWRASLGDAVEMLHAAGVHNIQNFATHTPYLFEIEKTREIFSRYYLPFKGAFETLYFNHHRVPFTSCDPHKARRLPHAGQARFLNHGHKGPDAETRTLVEAHFCHPAQWESGHSSSSVWYVIPSARPTLEAMRVLGEWRKMGYKVAVQRDPGADDLPVDLCITRPYRGYAEAVNHLARLVLDRDPSANWIVTGGDDLLPDFTFGPSDVAAECEGHFGGTFGIMQPTGDRHLVDKNGLCASERVCISPWMGRDWCSRAYGGAGPLCALYFHFFVDEELHHVALAQNALWHRSDIKQEHRWERRPRHLVSARSRYQEGKDLFCQRKLDGFPGSSPLHS